MLDIQQTYSLREATNRFRGYLIPGMHLLVSRARDINCTVVMKYAGIYDRSRQSQSSSEAFPRGHIDSVLHFTKGFPPSLTYTF